MNLEANFLHLKNSNIHSYTHRHTIFKYSIIQSPSNLFYSVSHISLSSYTQYLWLRNVIHTKKVWYNLHHTLKCFAWDYSMMQTGEELYLSLKGLKLSVLWYNYSSFSALLKGFYFKHYLESRGMDIHLAICFNLISPLSNDTVSLPAVPRLWVNSCVVTVLHLSASWCKL